MDKEGVAHVYSGILPSHEKDEIVPFAATWMDLQSIMLSETSQREKDKHCMISLCAESKKLINKQTEPQN